LMDAGEWRRFDPVRLGLNKDARIKNSQLLKLAQQNKRYIYDTKRVEHGNYGHYFAHFAQLTEKNKKDLIEYLKTL